MFLKIMKKLKFLLLIFKEVKIMKRIIAFFKDFIKNHSFGKGITSTNATASNFNNPSFTVNVNIGGNINISCLEAPKEITSTNYASNAFSE